MITAGFVVFLALLVGALFLLLLIWAIFLRRRPKNFAKTDYKTVGGTYGGYQNSIHTTDNDYDDDSPIGFYDNYSSEEEEKSEVETVSPDESEFSRTYETTSDYTDSSCDSYSSSYDSSSSFDSGSSDSSSSSSSD